MSEVGDTREAVFSDGARSESAIAPMTAQSNPITPPHRVRPSSRAVPLTLPLRLAHNSRADVQDAPLIPGDLDVRSLRRQTR